MVSFYDVYKCKTCGKKFAFKSINSFDKRCTTCNGDLKYIFTLGTTAAKIGGVKIVK